MGTAIHSIETGGSFLTGVEIDAHAYLGARRAALAELCRGHTDEVPMGAAGSESPPAGHYYNIRQRFHGTEIIPPSLLRVDADWLMRTARRTDPPTGWTLADARLDIYDFGVATAVLVWVPTAADSSDLDTLRDAIAELDVTAAAILDVFAAEVSRTLHRMFDGGPQRMPLADAVTPHDDEVRPGRSLWVWNHVLATSEARHASAAARAIAERVCPNDFHVVEHRDHTYAAGVYASVTCSAHEAREDAGTLSRAVAMQDAWWTLFWILDRQLVALLIELDAKSEPAGVSAAKERMDLIREVSYRVGLYRSRLDSVLVSSGARDIAAWNCLALAWDLEFRVGVVERKLTQLQAIYERAVSRLTEARTIRIAIMVYVFTAISLVSVAVTVAQYAEGGVNDSVGLRVVVLMLSIVTAAAAVAASLRVKSVRRGRPPEDLGPVSGGRRAG